MFTTLVSFFVILGILVFVHELGHFVAAKRSGAKVLEFGFGFPPRMFGIRRGGTIYFLNWIPLGGFVKIFGENGQNANEPGSFAALKLWKRGVILSSGVAMNVLLAMVILSLALAVGAPADLDTPQPRGVAIRDERVQILSVVPETPASRAGLRVGDVVRSIDGNTIQTVPQAQEYNAQHVGIAESVVIQRGTEMLKIEITPAVIDTQDQRAVWGVSLVHTGIVSYPWYSAIWFGVRSTFLLLWQIMVAFGEVIKNLVVHQQLSADLAGPIGIAALTGQVANLGFIYLLQFTALLSLNLAFINFLPLPALDGGRFLFLIIEKLSGQRLNVRLESMIHNVGFALLMLLVILVTIRDVNRFGGRILNFFGRLFSGGG